MCHLIYSKRFFNDKVGFYKQGQWGCSGIHPSQSILPKFQCVIWGGGNSWGGGWGPPNFWPTTLFFRGFHTPLTERYHQKWLFYVSHIMVMSIINLMTRGGNFHLKVGGPKAVAMLVTLYWGLHKIYNNSLLQTI